MSSLLAGVRGNTFGLFVEDGSLAIGIVVALAVAWAIATLAAQPQIAGWWLLGSLVALLVANVYRAGLRARRAIAAGSEPHA
jgi:hypothetical protein